MLIKIFPTRKYPLQGLFYFYFTSFIQSSWRLCSSLTIFWHHQLALFLGRVRKQAILPLPKQKVVWYSLAQWQPTTITNQTLLSSKDNALVSKTMTWRNNYAKGTWDPTIVGRSKRVLASKEGTKKDQKVPRVYKSDKTPAVHLSQI